jgi:CheY-like chemotaxis protein
MSTQELPKVLVVDDEQAMLASIRKLLEAEGYAVDVASSYRDMEEMLSKGGYDAILCEMWMSTMGGMEIQNRVKKKFSQYESRFIFATVNLATEGDTGIIEHENLPYMMEPAELLQKLRAVVAGHPRETDLGVEKRRHRRISLKAMVRVKRKNFSVGEPDIASIINVSRSGILFVTKNPYWVGAEVLIAYPYPDPTAIEQDGAVVRVDEGPDGSRQVAIELRGRS